MMVFLVSALLVLIAFSASSQQHDIVHYVKPNNSSSCPGQPCLTIDQYNSQGMRYYTSGATFFFLAGNHSIHSTVLLHHISNVILKGTENGSDVIVSCKTKLAIHCKNVTNLKIQGMVFVLYTDNKPEWLSTLGIFDSKEVMLFNLTFQVMSDTLGSAAQCNHSEVAFVSCLFEGNVGYYGGAIQASDGSKITLDGNVFIDNKALKSGGAIFINKSSLLLNDALGNTFKQNSAVFDGGAISCLDSKLVTSSNTSVEKNGHINFSKEQTLCGGLTVPIHQLCPHTTYFSNHEARIGGGAISLVNSEASLGGMVTIFLNNSANYGGALYSQWSNVTTSVKHLYFTRNRAQLHGGAYFGSSSSLRLGELGTNSHYFEHNSVEGNGGAIYHMSKPVHLTGRLFFANNRAGTSGGAIAIYWTTALFSGTILDIVNNSAHDGGGVVIYNSKVAITTAEVNLINNSAKSVGGGLLLSLGAELQVNQIHFLGNLAQYGGGIQSGRSNCRVISANYIDNKATEYGGAISAVGGNVSHHNISVKGNSGTAIYIIQSNASFSGDVRIIKNTGEMIGGGIRAIASSLSFTGMTVLEENNVNGDGGAIGLSLKTTLSFNGVVLLRNNSATGNGGSITATRSSIIVNGKVTFSSNQAENGGAMYFENGASITLKKKAALTTSYNHANEYGGAIYHRDAITPSQCKFGSEEDENTLPSCFLDFKVQNIYGHTTTGIKISSINDSADNDGSFLYGGMLDKCLKYVYATYNYLHFPTPQYNTLYHILNATGVLSITSKNSTMVNPITSKPYTLCFCESNQEFNCSEVLSMNTYRGRKFTVFLLPVAQVDTLSSALVRAKLTTTARLEQDQILQTVPQVCTGITYNLYSYVEQEALVLYLDGGSCPDTKAAQAVVNVTFLPCPDAFTLSGDHCDCEQRLQKYAECTISDDEFSITRKPESKFWMNASYSSGIYQGPILYPKCPIGYCKDELVNISLVEPDVQCDHNRSGVLCGACAANHSLMLGSSKCQTCSNTYLALLLPFAAAGIALVVFLSILRLTVATGVINSVILYANIVQANRNLLFPSSTSTNVLTVFIAWMNLDLGFHTCFYDGMDAYVQTWLQFVFPIYVWLLISLIILTSRYSMTVTKLIGSNPVAVLATLLLMSYTKVLKVIIEVYSSVDLNYPGNKTVTVWLKDANVPYLQSWHLALAVVTALVLVFLFLPYTLLLLLGYKLYYFTGKKHTRWLIRIMPLLDSYYAPFKIHTRYWTGLLLLVRCALYIIFSFNSLGHAIKSLLAISATFSLLFAWLTMKVYTNFYTNAIEALVYSNLIILSTAALADSNSPALVNSLVGIVFAIMMGIIVYHFHILYMAKSTVWLKILAKLAIFKRGLKNHTTTETVPLLASVADTPPQHPVVTRSIVALRETLLTD